MDDRAEFEAWYHESNTAYEPSQKRAVLAAWEAARQSQQATLERRTELLRECLAELDPFSQKLTIARIDAELGGE